MANFSKHATIYRQSEQIVLSGYWINQYLNSVAPMLDKMNWPSEKHLVFNLNHLYKIDINGAFLLLKLIQDLEYRDYKIVLDSINPEVQQILALVESYLPSEPIKLIEKSNPFLAVFENIGVYTVSRLKELLALLAFIGQICLQIFPLFPIKLRSIKQCIIQIERTGFDALPIVGLLAFLIGVVLAYQMGIQLERYGGNLYLVDFSAFGILREFAPLITAIIFAGRTGAAFTAELANMTLSQEIAAMQVMGISALDRLVLPRIIATLISIPLVTVWADLMGLFGAMMMANHLFHISCWHYIQRLSEVISLKTYLLGLVKTPIFALLISMIACYQGLSVSEGSREIGKKTTQSVVQSIFFIIVVDALFSILFSWQGL